jgi:Ca2+-binding EF-hand superfamily protein
MRYLLSSALVLTALGLGLAADPGTPKTDSERDVQDFVYLGDKAPLLIRFHVRIDGKPLLDVWEEFIGKVFDYADVNGDGVLSKDEAARVRSLPVLSNIRLPVAGWAPNVGQLKGKSKDGQITRGELANYLRQRGAGPFQFAAGGSQRNQLAVRFVGQPAPLSADKLNQTLFTLLDADKDGKLSREELARAPAVLQKLDADDDELVSAQEMSGNVPSGVETRFVVAAAFADTSPNNTPFVMVTPGDANKQFARRLQERYGEEFSDFTRRAPDMEFLVRLGKRTGKEAVVETVAPEARLSPLAQSVRRGAGGTLLLESGTTQIELGSGAESSGIRYLPAQSQQFREEFRRADKDNNGYLDKNEANQSQRFRGLFGIMDRDGDGKLFEKEITAYLEQTKGLQEAASRGCVSLTVKDQGRGLFDMADANGDGRLGVREMRQMVKLIDQLDRDGDGWIGEGEIPHKYRLDVTQGPANGNPFAPQVVALTKATMRESAPPPSRTGGPVWFRKMDRNNDGDVSRREFLGTDEEFCRIDTDGDGLISTEEAERADKLFRKAKEAQP